MQTVPPVIWTTESSHRRNGQNEEQRWRIAFDLVNARMISVCSCGGGYRIAVRGIVQDYY